MICVILLLAVQAQAHDAPSQDGAHDVAGGGRTSAARESTTRWCGRDDDMAYPWPNATNVSGRQCATSAPGRATGETANGPADGSQAP
eukprot:2260084-Prymnesium_polylepis.1